MFHYRAWKLERFHANACGRSVVEMMRMAINTGL
jgi:hypothetical protein